MVHPSLPSMLRMERRLFGEMVAHLNETKPDEGVGLLAGFGDGSAVHAVRFFPGTNLDASPTRYTMDPAEVIRAFQEMRAWGWELVAVVHSHPGSPPTPSATDLREAHYPDALLLIVGLASCQPVARCWLLTRNDEESGIGETTVREVPVHLTGDGPTNGTADAYR